MPRARALPRKAADAPMSKSSFLPQASTQKLSPCSAARPSRAQLSTRQVIFKAQPSARTTAFTKGDVLGPLGAYGVGAAQQDGGGLGGGLAAGVDGGQALARGYGVAALLVQGHAYGEVHGAVRRLAPAREVHTDKAHALGVYAPDVA